MKKVVLIVGTVVFAAIAAQAQSAGVEVRLMDASMKKVLAQNAPKRNAKAASRDTTKLGCAVERQVVKQVQQVAAAQVSKPAARPQQNKTVAQQEKKGDTKQWIKAIFLGGRFPGESAAQYRARLVAQSQPASLPFK